MKKLIALMVAVVILASSNIIYAAEKMAVLTIEDVKKTALEKSEQVAIDELNIKCKEAILQNSKYDLMIDSGPTLENAYKSGVEPIEVETNVEVAKRTKDENIQTLNYEAYKAALNVLLEQKLLDTEKNKLAILQDKYSIANAKYKQKTITENDLYDVEYNLEIKKNDVSKAEDTLDSEKLELQKILGMSVNDVYVDVKDDLKYLEYEEINLEKIIQEAMSTNLDIYQKSQNLKLREKNLEVIGRYIKSGNSTYDSAYYDLETAKLELSDAEVNLEADIRNKYNDLLNLQDKVEVATKYTDLMTKKHTAAESKYKKGIINKESYLVEKEKYLDAVYQRYVAIHDHNLLKLEFENLIS